MKALKLLIFFSKAIGWSLIKTGECIKVIRFRIQIC